MTPEERSLLERTYKLTEENNEMLRSMRRMSRISTVGRLLYWAVILLVGFGAFYFIKPYMDTLIGVYGQLQDNLNANPSSTDLLFDLWK